MKMIPVFPTYLIIFVKNEDLTPSFYHSYGVGTKRSISGILVESFVLAPTNELTQ